MQADERQVVPAGMKVAFALVSSPRMNIAFRPATKKKKSTATRYWIADDLVVGAEPEVAPGAVLLAFAQGRRLTQHPPQRIVEEAKPEQPAERGEQQPEEDRDVVLVGLGLVLDRGCRSAVPSQCPNA